MLMGGLNSAAPVQRRTASTTLRTEVPLAPLNGLLYGVPGFAGRALFARFAGLTEPLCVSASR
jgi:hypothetical protein